MQVYFFFVTRRIVYYLRAVFFLNLVLSLTVLLLIIFILAVLSRINILSKQIEVIEEEMLKAETRLQDLKEKFNE